MRPDRCLLWLLMFALPVAIGCDAAKQAATAVKGGVETGISKAKELASEAGASMSNAATKATAAVDTDGAMTLSLGETLQLEQCFAHFAASVGERSAILQLRSYESRASGEAAAMVHILVDAPNLESVTGTYPARVFLQSAGGEIWDNVDGTPVTVNCRVEEGKLQVEFQDGELVNATTGARNSLTGSATAMLP